MERLKLWLPALLWLPGGIIAEEVLRAGSVYGMMTPLAVLELSAVAPCGLPLALACRRLARSGGVGLARRSRSGGLLRYAPRRRSGAPGLSPGMGGGLAGRAKAPPPGIRSLVRMARARESNGQVPPPGVE